MDSNGDSDDYDDLWYMKCYYALLSLRKDSTLLSAVVYRLAHRRTPIKEIHDLARSFELLLFCWLICIVMRPYRT